MSTNGARKEPQKFTEQTQLCWHQIKVVRTLDWIKLERFTLTTKMNLFVNRDQFNKQLGQQVRIAGKLACGGRLAISPLILSPNAISCSMVVMTVIITAIHNKNLNCTLDINIQEYI